MSYYAHNGRYFIVDAYTSRPFAGNPAGVCITDHPMTGSAHCVPGPYWQRLTGRNRFHAFQESRRGGELVVEVKEGGGREGTGEGGAGRRVILTGDAITVMKGTLA